MGCLTVLILFNLGYVWMYPDTATQIGFGFITGFITTVLAVGVLSGVQVFGSGLSDETIKIIFVVASILNLMFQFTIPLVNVPIGLGLMNNAYNVFVTGTTVSIMGYFGFAIILIMSILVLVSGLMIAVG